MGDKTFTWRNGKELASYNDTNNNVSYIYNNDGIRTSKVVNNVTTNYYLKGNKIVFEEKNNTVLYFIYNNDELVGFKYNGNTYHYHKNLFGDVIGIYDSNINEIVTYEYDSWGAIVNTIDNSNINLSTINPFRYRSYYYDEETKFYYLNSRYYNPKVGRFINADAYVSTGQGTIGHNMYNYCGNNPVNRIENGYKWLESLKQFVQKLVETSKRDWSKLFSKKQSYDSADEAAMAFANETYNKSSYVRIEYAAEIYYVMDGKNKKYYYTTPRAYEPHGAKVGEYNVLDNGVYVAYVHTHPNSNEFSTADKRVANNMGVNAYVVGPNLILQKYNQSKGKITELGSVTPIELTQREKEQLKNQFAAKWDEHIKEGCDFSCENKVWPNE